MSRVPAPDRTVTLAPPAASGATTDAHAAPAAQPCVSRRTFLAAVGSGACASLGAAVLLGAAFHGAPSSSFRRQRTWLYAAAVHPSDPGAIHIFAIEQGSAVRLGATRCPGVTALALHPWLPVLYAVTDAVQGQPLPHGHLEAFSVDRETALLHSMARVPLSLSATGPRSLAVSPDGSSLLVAAAAGGLWNAFALDTAGTPAAVAVARKEVGTKFLDETQSAAQPHSLLYLPGSRLALATDSGSSRLSILEAEKDRIAIRARFADASATSPSHLALTSDGAHLLVAHALQPSLALCPVQQLRTHQFESMAAPHGVHRIPLDSPISALLAHPDAPFVFSLRPAGTTSRLERWQVTSDSRLHMQPLATLGFPAPTALACAEGVLWAATATGLVRVRLDDAFLCRDAVLQAPLHGITSVAVRHDIV